MIRRSGVTPRHILKIVVIVMSEPKRPLDRARSEVFMTREAIAAARFMLIQAAVLSSVC